MYFSIRRFSNISPDAGETTGSSASLPEIAHVNDAILTMSTNKSVILLSAFDKLVLVALKRRRLDAVGRSVRGVNGVHVWSSDL